MPGDNAEDKAEAPITVTVGAVDPALVILAAEIYQLDPLVVIPIE
jgi:hypothetical protein